MSLEDAVVIQTTPSTLYPGRMEHRVGYVGNLTNLYDFTDGDAWRVVYFGHAPMARDEAHAEQMAREISESLQHTPRYGITKAMFLRPFNASLGSVEAMRAEELVPTGRYN